MRKTDIERIDRLILTNMTTTGMNLWDICKRIGMNRSQAQRVMVSYRLVSLRNAGELIEHTDQGVRTWRALIT